jgi:HJR/Mrr/RecB family endonuclease
MNEDFDIASFNSIGNTINPKWIINESVNDQFDGIDNSLVPDMFATEYCPYCSSKFICKDFTEYAKNANHIIESLEIAIQNGRYSYRTYCLKVCPNCLHWKFSGYQAPKQDHDEYFIISAVSVLQKFTTTLPTGCSIELAQQLRRNASLWHTLAPRRMETFVADIFKSNHKHCEVVHVGRPGDLGVDVLFIDDTATKWLIQVKRREKPNKAEGFSTLQSILGTLVLHGEQHGIIVSTADYFSSQVKKQAASAANRGYKVDLIDKGILDRMIGSLLPERPWINLFSHADVCNVIGDLKSDFLHFDRAKDQHIERIVEKKIIEYIDPNQLKLFDS